MAAFSPWLPLFAALLTTGHAIKCWECNSRYDPNCGDPFYNATFAITDCDQRTLDHYPGQKATICRKIQQKVKDDYRFVRGCGWLDSDKEGQDCFKRAGTFNVLIQYCSCNNDGCNDAPHQRPLTMLIPAILMLLLAATLKTMH